MKKLAVLLVVVAFLTASTGLLMAGGEKESAATGEEEWVEYDVYYETDKAQQWFDNPDDVVTPWIENKYKLKVREIFWPSGQPSEQRINTLMACPTAFLTSLSQLTAQGAT